MQIRDVMTSGAEWIQPTETLAHVAARMRDKGIGCLPVGESDRLIGMITDRDIVCRAVANGMNLKAATARDVMSTGCTYCFEDQDIEDAAMIMEQKNIHHLAVLNRQKRLVGILTLGDMALRGPQNLFSEVARLAARDAARHAAQNIH